MDKDAEVHFSYNYGDHWRTQVAPRVRRIEEGVVQFSAYHSMDKIEDDEDELYDAATGNYKEDVRRVVVIG